MEVFSFATTSSAEAFLVLIPLADDVWRKISDLDLEVLVPDHLLVQSLYRRCDPLRNSLAKQEKSADYLPPLSTSTFWEVTPKNRFDILSVEIPKNSIQLVYAIATAAIYLPQVAKPFTYYSPSIADSFFWYHIDFGTRLISSGWDRISLLLDLAFDLKTSRECCLQVVLKEIPHLQPEAALQESFKKLKKFRDTDFSEIEGKSSLANRHEVTHIISPSTRFFFEFLDAAVKKPGRVLPQERAYERLQLLLRHHKLLLDGIESAIDLVSWKWPEL
jgi:hypothetical protein